MVDARGELVCKRAEEIIPLTVIVPRRMRAINVVGLIKLICQLISHRTLQDSFNPHFPIATAGDYRGGLLFAAVVAAAAGGIAGRARISAGTLTTAAALGATIRSALAA